MTDIPATDWVYDLETYLDLFCADVTHVASRTRYIFEVSDRIDQSREFIAFIFALRDSGARMFGYNNEGFDWPVIDHLIRITGERGSFTALDAHKKGTEIITGDRFAHTVWPSDRIVTQGDLFKIHHFDNFARSTSLKKLEIAMRSDMVVDLPYPPDQPTTSVQKDEIIRYMCHDVSETLRFHHASLEQIRFRDELAAKYPDMGDVLNFNDTKIGKKFFERELERAGTPCYERVGGRRVPRQTRRETIALRDVILPYVSFNDPDLQRIHRWLSDQVLTHQAVEDSLKETEATVNTKGVFKDLSATVRDFTFHFGTGGIHGSIENAVVRADDEHEIWDWDVASYYPNLAIANRFYPAHLSETFCDVYSEVFHMRRQHKKGTAENAMLKLALNGVYGDSNNKYSPFYDPQYTMSITVNGQLLLCMLSEWLMAAPEVQMIQANTDGITVRLPKTLVPWMNDVCAHWMKMTGLELESAQYDAMFIRDVNSYIAVKHGGKGLKRIGAYAYQTWFDDPHTRERQWHQNHSALVVKKAAEARMIHNTSLVEFIQAHGDLHDFQLSVKVPRNSRLEWGNERIQNVTRYFVSTDGHGLTKVMPPLKGKTEERRIGVDAGWTVTPTNDIRAFDWDKVNWKYYVREAEKLVIDG
jgi:hypothetical protein